ncbi:Glu/Leu/Phe/Val dehydrogenase dimerization domain-containing protein [Calderihabitans maritimus]|uniref:Leucine dehydrogenase n=1 Tax=Calderihabitans maritimus TaxID=1246530 RepID=A0A1Z5HS59_9FIRM|nr:Glu/Leu/Phe/Val dehydrogenase dimerization domain-containing protein [Calderihabitans maritimus]GAW92354.1 leucine dehydrogenase [Calderihabitans maritimus]
MRIFEYFEKEPYEQVVYGYDTASGLKTIIAIHNTTLGPALGGVRMWPYASEEEALVDVLRLSRAMTYKAAAADMNLGGGKAVIIGDPRRDKTEKLLRAYGRFVDSLGGRYITAEDVGVGKEDMDIIKRETGYVVGVTGGSGDPSPFTAYGVWLGMKAAVKEVYGKESLEGLTIAVQGLGKVGCCLCRHLYRDGARLVVTDINHEAVKKAVKEFGAEAVNPEEIYGVKCDIFAPCALGAVVNDATIPRFNCKIIAGCANNVLEDDQHGDFLHDMGILYVPDYIINAGGLINVAEELGGYNRQRALDKINRIYNTVKEVISLAKGKGIPPYQAADMIVRERIGRAKHVPGVCQRGDMVG